ncbi:hypothetical protein [Arthrobacter sp. NEB 688]|uniref:hypothetical protein n=1 Tax=Arthrobacter sp. NEB 688 TaxID=904039 RepID=UPI001565DD49|nr:hypothetical protein [Arthrobacter sp. NEB 688]QKE82990.1 hypothetical protein HL663_02825 [Arthrobacter sp. NEB 688]
MSFFERAKAAASDLAAKADVAMSNAGVNVPGMGGDRALRDLGVLAWLDATGRPVDAADRERVMATLRELESSGRLGPLTVTPAQPYGTPPPPPGAAGAGAATTPPPPPGASAPQPPPPTPGAGSPPPPGGVSPAGDAPAGPPPGAAPDARPPLPDTDEQPPSSTPPPPPPPPSWA